MHGFCSVFKLGVYMCKIRIVLRHGGAACFWDREVGVWRMASGAHSEACLAGDAAAREDGVCVQAGLRDMQGFGPRRTESTWHVQALFLKGYFPLSQRRARL